MHKHGRRCGARGHRPASVEPIEPRRLLAADTGLADLQPVESHAADGDHPEIDFDLYRSDGEGNGGSRSGGRGGGGGGGGMLLGDGADRISENEPNNTRGGADPVPLGPDGVLIDGGITPGDIDYFRFTLEQKSGLFIDVDATETGLSSLNSRIQVFDAGGSQIGSNNSGYDFEGFTLGEYSATPASVDPSLYIDLSAGEYFIAVSGEFSSTGAYELKLAYETQYVSAVPALDSLPGAAQTIYLDFDGHSSSTDAWAGSNGAYSLPRYDFDGDPSVYSPGEQMAMANIWRVAAEDFAPFNINVSTVEPPVFADSVALRVAIGGYSADINRSGSAVGVAYVNSWAYYGQRYKTVFVFAAQWMNSSAFAAAGTSGYIMGAANESGNTASHEVGHAMGLHHYTTDSSYRGALLYTPDFGLNRERWFAGTNSNNASQNDIDVILRSANQINYRPDDHGSTLTGATMLAEDATGDFTFAADGLVHRSNDVDLFRFESAGDTTVTLEISEFFGNLDGSLAVLDESGTVIASAATARLGEEVTLTALPAGTYYARVTSRGGVGDIGQYRLGVVTETDTQPPVITDAHFGWESAQEVVFTFDEALDPETLSAGDLSLLNRTTGQTISSSSIAVTYDADTFTATFSFPGFTGGILPDGNYTALLPAGSVSDVTGNALADENSLDFFVLAGDADRDRDVDFFDFLTLRSNYNSSGTLFSDGDFNYSGTVDFFDFLILRGNYGLTLPPAGGGSSLFSDRGVGDNDNDGKGSRRTLLPPNGAI